VAVQSHWFSVGPIVPWARPGVGAIATQANAEISYGPNALELLSDGVPAQQALDRLLAADPGSAGRQVAIVDAQGRVATHTGPNCIPYAGHAAAENVSCQANLMASESVWPAMLETYCGSSAPLVERLLSTLEAAEAEGGDVRGRQSAAILVVPQEGEWWRKSRSLRVEDDPDPLVELRRLVRIHEAYMLADRADHLANDGRHEEAAALYRQAAELAPDNHELRFWAALGAAQGGDMEAALAHARAAIDAHPQWRELIERLPPDVAPSAEPLLAQLREAEAGRA
jgi:uncharacterized Ntn-hydrolase superfamily protein